MYTDETAVNALKRNWGKADTSGRLGILLAAVMLVSALFLLCAWICGALYSGIVNFMNPEEAEPALYYGLHEAGLFSVLLFSVSVLCMILVLSRRQIRNGVLFTSEEGIMFKQRPTHGSGRNMTKAEAAQVYSVCDIADTKETVYGQFTRDGRQVCAYRRNGKGASGNRNIMILGSPGTGKSYCFVRTELIQTILRGDSFVVTDPSQELLLSLAQFCRDRGADVRILNLVDYEHSDCWDCFSEIIDPDTERIDAARAQNFASVYVTNSGSGDEEMFWRNSAINLLIAAIGLAAWKRETAILADLRLVYDRVANGEADYRKNRKLFSGMTSIRFCKDLILQAAGHNGISLQEIREIFQGIEDHAPQFNIRTAFNILLNFNDIQQEFEEIDDSQAGKVAWRIFCINESPTVRGSALQGLLIHLNQLTDEKLGNVISHKGIVLSDINQRQSAYFVVTNDADAGISKPIASLFFTFLFDDAQKSWDRSQQLAGEKGVPNPCRPVTVMLDEFFSLGVIGGDPARFATIMAVSRKRELHICIILQNYTQLASLYGEENALTIQNCCSSVLFLGCNDQKTADFVSVFLSGDATVQTESHADSASLFSLGRSLESVSVSAVNRKVLTLEEARRYADKQKVMFVGYAKHPVDLNAFTWKEHPCFLSGEIRETSIYSLIRPLSQRLAEMDGRGSWIERRTDEDGVIHETDLLYQRIRELGDTEHADEGTDHDPPLRKSKCAGADRGRGFDGYSFMGTDGGPDTGSGMNGFISGNASNRYNNENGTESASDHLRNPVSAAGRRRRGGRKKHSELSERAV